jgi:hypothetical protein
MTKEERGKLLRARFRALGGFPLDVLRASRKRTAQPVKAKQPGRGGPFYGVALADVRPAWVSVPDARVSRPLGARNRTPKPALVSIMEKQPEKLARLGYWRGGKFVP